MVDETVLGAHPQRVQTHHIQDARGTAGRKTHDGGSVLRILVAVPMFKLASHQVYGSSLIDAVGSVGLFYGCGCGKTATVLDWVYRHVADGSAKEVLVVCPASLRSNWALSIDRMAEFEGYSPEGIEAVRKAIVIRSYQGIYKAVTRETRHRNGTSSSRRSYALKDDVAHRWDLVVADESHALGSHSSVQTRMCLELAKLADIRVAMSGTPVTGGGGRADWSKLYGQMEFIDPGIFGSWKAFCQRYVRKMDIWGNPSSYDETACEDVINSHGAFVRLEDVRDMPERVFTAIPVRMGRRARRAYDDILKGRTEEWGIDIRIAGAQYAKLYQVCSGFLYRDDGTCDTFETEKDALIRQLVEDADGKVVIFARYSHSIDKLCQMIPGAVRFDGSSKGPTWMDLQYGDARILVVQYKKGCAGTDLFASHLMIFYEPTLSALELDQAQDRIYRTGQVNQCRYVFLYAEDSFEQKAVESIRSGVDVTHELMAKWAQ